MQMWIGWSSWNFYFHIKDFLRSSGYLPLSVSLNISEFAYKRYLGSIHKWWHSKWRHLNSSFFAKFFSGILQFSFFLVTFKLLANMRTLPLKASFLNSNFRIMKYFKDLRKYSLLIRRTELQLQNMLNHANHFDLFK